MDDELIATVAEIVAELSQERAERKISVVELAAGGPLSIIADGTADAQRGAESWDDAHLELDLATALSALFAGRAFSMPLVGSPGLPAGQSWGVP